MVKIKNQFSLSLALNVTLLFEVPEKLLRFSFIFFSEKNKINGMENRGCFV